MRVLIVPSAGVKSSGNPGSRAAEGVGDHRLDGRLDVRFGLLRGAFALSLGPDVEAPGPSGADLPGSPNAAIVAKAFVIHRVGAQVGLRPVDLVGLRRVPAHDDERPDGVGSRSRDASFAKRERQIHPLATSARVRIEPYPGAGAEVLFHGGSYFIASFSQLQCAPSLLPR